MGGGEALTGPQDSVAAMVEEFRVGAISSSTASTPYRCDVPSAGGAFYAFPDISGTGLSGAELVDRLLHEGGVSALAGTAFGHVGTNHLRFSYANSRETSPKR